MFIAKHLVLAGVLDGLKETAQAVTTANKHDSQACHRATLSCNAPHSIAASLLLIVNTAADIAR